MEYLKACQTYPQAISQLQATGKFTIQVNKLGRAVSPVNIECRSTETNQRHDNIETQTDTPADPPVYGYDHGGLRIQ
ncbi:hypothetical protein [Endozoicomonas sp. Mp262]|uniref:hypothetical protein n=1 Tax=Endozoicomonas sp. Mp262 TaxID=2919499 RepID=UPI0021D7E720